MVQLFDLVHSVGMLLGTLTAPLDESHLVALRGLIHQEVSTKVRQRGELN